MDKDLIKIMTQQMTEPEAQYVAGIKQILDDCGADAELVGDDIIYVAKIMAFADKFRVLHWSAMNMSMHKELDKFCNIIEEYKDSISECIQGIIGNFDGTEFTKLELPISNNPLEIINELKQCVENWFQLHLDDMNYEGCRNATSDFIQKIRTEIYLLRICSK